MISHFTTILVLIVDDHSIFRQGLATIINRDPEQPAEVDVNEIIVRPSG